MQKNTSSAHLQWNTLRDRPHQTSSPTTKLWDCMSTTRKKIVRSTSTWRWTNLFLNNHQVTEEFKKEIHKFLETNNNENMTTQNLRDPAKEVLRGKFTALQSYLKKKINIHLKQVEENNKKKNNNNNSTYDISIRESKPSRT